METNQEQGNQIEKFISKIETLTDKSIENHYASSEVLA